MTKSKVKDIGPTPGPSSNWLNVQKMLQESSSAPRKSAESAFISRKRRRIDEEKHTPSTVGTERNTTVETQLSFVRGPAIRDAATSIFSSSSISTNDLKNGESLAALRKMIAGEVEFTPAQQQPGKYISIDCEMVGVGPEGLESSLARVSLVNYYGAVQLDVFVRQRERVVDYRTQYSGIRPKDLVNAKPFAEVQKLVADLLDDRILVGHAVHNDLKALLLSHPRQQTRDTQQYAAKHNVMRSRRPALRHLVLQELGVKIQEGEHSSVIDARATMALYRLHRIVWEKGNRPVLPPSAAQSDKSNAAGKGKHRMQDTGDGAHSHESQTFPGGGRKGISSGLSTVITRKTSAPAKNSTSQWWKELGDKSAKGSIRLSR